MLWKTPKGINTNFLHGTEGRRMWWNLCTRNIPCNETEDSHYVNTCIDPRLRQVKDFERIKQEKGRRNVFTDALKARSEVQIDIQFKLDESTTVVRIDQDRTTEIYTSKPNMLTKYLKKVLQRKHQEAIKSQNRQGKFLTTVWNDEDLAEQYFAYMGWKIYQII